MVSQLGVSSDVMPFKVTLQAGQGEGDPQTIQVKVLRADPPDSPASK